MSDEIDPKVKQKILEEYTKNGRGILSSGPKLRPLSGLSYTDIARKLFPVEPMPQGAILIYDEIDNTRCEKCGMLLSTVSDLVTNHEHTEEECLLYLVHES